MTALENVLMGTQRRVPVSIGRLTWDVLTRKSAARETRARQDALRVMSTLGLLDDRDRLISELPFGTRRRVDMARALAGDPRTLLLDEPFSGLGDRERPLMSQIIHEIRKEGTVGMVLVEHDMTVVTELCDELLVLNEGVVLATGDPRSGPRRAGRAGGLPRAPAQAPQEGVGMSAQRTSKTPQTTKDAVQALLSVDRINVSYGEVQALFDVSLRVPPKSVGALIGPNGAGKSTLLKSILGVVPISTGTVTFAGEDVTRLTVPKTVRRGITLVPEGRELFAGLSVIENLELGRTVASKRSSTTDDLLDSDLPALPGPQEAPVAGRRVVERRRAADGRDRPALMSEPTLLMLDEPSLGLAPVMVERIVSGIARVTEDFDMSVLMVEQNIGAAAALADRVVVMNVGRVVAERDATGEEGFDIDELTAMYWGQHTA